MRRIIGRNPRFGHLGGNIVSHLRNTPVRKLKAKSPKDEPMTPALDQGPNEILMRLDMENESVVRILLNETAIQHAVLDRAIATYNMGDEAMRDLVYDKSDTLCVSRRILSKYVAGRTIRRITTGAIRHLPYNLAEMTVRMSFDLPGSHDRVLNSDGSRELHIDFEWTFQYKTGRLLRNPIHMDMFTEDKSVIDNYKQVDNPSDYEIKWMSSVRNSSLRFPSLTTMTRVDGPK